MVLLFRNFLTIVEVSFENKYYDNFDEGIYCSIASETPLFSSKDKFDAGNGWPSFSKPIKGAPIGEF